MKKFHFFLFASLVVIAVSCKTTKSSVSVREKSETSAQSSHRLTSVLTADSLSQWLALSADSMVLLFDATPSGRSIKDTLHLLSSLDQKYMTSPDANAPDDMYFFSKRIPPAVSVQPSADADGAHTAQSKPKALKIYGLHIGAGSDKKSVKQSSLTESNDKSMHSEQHKEDNKTKSSPSSAPKYIFYILLIACAFFIYYKLRS